MRHFSEHLGYKTNDEILHDIEPIQQSLGDIQCEEALMEAFQK